MDNAPLPTQLNIKNRTISTDNILLLQAVTKNARLLGLNCYQLITLNSRYLWVIAHHSLIRQAQRKHCLNWRKY